MEKIYIVGAHSRARTLAAYFRYLYPDTILKAYLVDNEEENPEVVDGVPVIHIDKDTRPDTDCAVFIGTRGVYHQKLEEKLAALGFHAIYPVTAELDSGIRKKYLKKYFKEKGRDFCLIDDMGVTKNVFCTCQNAGIYVAKSVYDKPLKQEYKSACYEKEIQVGAALTGERLGNDILTDSTGDNISAQNRQFCELTGLYWIWKHAGEDIVGLVHYRRHFLLPEDWKERMQYHHIDVILPIPLYVGPSLAENFKLRHDPSDWDNMMEYLKEHNVSEYSQAEKFFSRTNLYSPCNMFIMRKEVLDTLCTWLFPILFASADCGGIKKDSYLNRYPGFLSERLITFFFEKYREKYKIVYADKNFLA